MDLSMPGSGGRRVRDYLVDLLAALWAEGDGFSAKRPLGDSGWQWDIYDVLFRAGFIPGKVDADGELVDVDVAAADELVAAAIEFLRD